jgi:MFS family permease
MSNPLTKSGGPALYLGIVQFVFVSTWTVYAIFLPVLLASVGIAKQWTAWVLMADQVLFVVFDVAAGYAADRVNRLYGRIGPWVVGVTALSCLTFLLMPWLAVADGENGAAWRAPLLLTITAIWAITSSALRAPAFALISRHAAKPQIPSLAGFALMGMALAGAIAPWLGASLRDLDPRLPFAVSSLSLLVLAAGLIWAERSAALPADSKDDEVSEVPTLRPKLFFPLLALAALGYQILFNLDAAPRYLRDAQPQDLLWLMPVFWIGFNGSVALADRITKRIAVARLFAIACGLGAVSAASAMYFTGLGAASIGQLVAGLAWGAALVAAFGVVGEFASGPNRQRHATLTGLLFSMLALATFARIGINASGLMQQWSTPLLAAPALLWLAVAAIALTAGGQRKAA